MTKRTKPAVVGLLERIQRAAASRDTKAEIYQEMRIPQSTLDNWINGVNEPSIGYLLKFAKATKHRAWWLISGEGPPTDGPGLAPTLQSVDEYLTGSARGQSTPEVIADLLRSGAPFYGLGIASPTWDDVDDVRRILERHAAPPPPPRKRISDSEPVTAPMPKGAHKADPNQPLIVPVRTKPGRWG